MIIGSKDLRSGMVVIFNNELWRVMEATHFSPGKGSAFVQAKLRHVIKGNQTEHKFRSGESVERVSLERRSAEYLYQEGNAYFFMDSENYEQVQISEELLGEQVRLLTPNMLVQIESYEERPLGIALPKSVKLSIVETEPHIKTATVTNSMKKAKVETGATVNVPGFINEGEVVEIDTATGEYMGRA